MGGLHLKSVASGQQGTEREPRRPSIQEIGNFCFLLSQGSSRLPPLVFVFRVQVVSGRWWLSPSRWMRRSVEGKGSGLVSSEYEYLKDKRGPLNLAMSVSLRKPLQGCPDELHLPFSLTGLREVRPSSERSHQDSRGRYTGSVSSKGEGRGNLLTKYTIPFC
jgi:hypothetical protein